VGRGGSAARAGASGAADLVLDVDDEGLVFEAAGRGASRRGAEAAWLGVAAG